MNIFYELDGKLYANITNACPCDCTFCLRNNDDSVGGNSSLWLERQPRFEDIKKAFDEFDITGFTDLVFCGYGEPMTFADLLIETAQYIKSKSQLKIRINTCGLVELINPKFNLNRMKGVIDSVSISLNAPSAEKYQAVVRPSFGEKSFDAMLKFAQKSKEIVAETFFTIVDILPPDDIEACIKLSNDLDVPLRIRTLITDNVKYE